MSGPLLFTFPEYGLSQETLRKRGSVRQIKLHFPITGHSQTPAGLDACRSTYPLSLITPASVMAFPSIE